MNRAASIGVALPCVVPKEWIAPPDFETADGELMDDEERNESHERSGMLRDMDTSLQRRSVEFSRDDEWDSEEERRQGGSGKGKGKVRDTSGRVVPPAERAPAKKMGPPTGSTTIWCRGPAAPPLVHPSLAHAPCDTNHRARQP